MRRRERLLLTSSHLMHLDPFFKVSETQTRLSCRACTPGCAPAMATHLCLPSGGSRVRAQEGAVTGRAEGESGGCTADHRERQLTAVQRDHRQQQRCALSSAYSSACLLLLLTRSHSAPTPSRTMHTHALPLPSQPACCCRLPCLALQRHLLATLQYCTP